MVTVEWFAAGVTEEYLQVYQHRDEHDARRLVDLIGASVTCEHGSPALDVACGAGRHRHVLGSHRWTVGLDVSRPLLAVARAADARAPLVQADMRALPFRNATFALVVNLFTSFGYFEDDAEHRQALSEFARVTTPGGWFVLDFLNPSHVRGTLVPLERQQLGPYIVEQKREITRDGRYVRKAIRFEGSDRLFLERVRLFERGELIAMVRAAGFAVSQVLGDYTAGPITPSSPRTIIVARRSLDARH